MQEEENMKQSTMMRILGLVLVFALLITFSACGDTTAPQNTGMAETDKPSTQPSASASSSAEVAESQEPMEPAVLQVLSLPSNTSGLIQNWWTAILKERIKIELEVLPAGDQGEQKLQAMMSSGELPDIVVFKSKKQVEDAVMADMLLDLDAHLDKIPNIVKHASVALQYYRDSASSGKGRAYAVPSRVGPGEVGEELNWGPFLRWDLYKALGSPKITTLEDYLPLLKQMQDMESKNADGQKVYAFQLWNDWDGIQMHQATQPAVLSGIDAGDMLGGSLPFMEVDFNSGSTKSILDPDSQYIRALKFYYQANQMGLVDPDSLTQRFDAALAKVEQGRCLFSWWPWFSGGFDTLERTNAESFRGFRPVLPDDYKAFWWGNNPVGEPWSFAIGASSKEPEAALRLLDFMYSPDALMELFNGPRGLTWDVDTQGKPYVTEQGWDIIDNQKDLPDGGKLWDGSSVLNVAGLSSAGINPDLGEPLSYGFWATSQGRNPTKLMKDWQDTTGFKSTTAMLKDKGAYTMTPLAMYLVPTISDDMQALAQQVGDIVKVNSWLMVFSKNSEEFDKHYKEMVEKAEGLGIQQILDWDVQAWTDAQTLAGKYEN
jgi:putative aldouronate transport system substrate-binding protein